MSATHVGTGRRFVGFVAVGAVSSAARRHSRIVRLNTVRGRPVTLSEASLSEAA